MNIKIKSTGVFCLLGDDYDRVYAALKKQLGDDKAQLFTERTPGHGYLQWELPGEGWEPLSEAEPFIAIEVRRLLEEKSRHIRQLFGSNQNAAQSVLSVPDDSYVYYKANSDGTPIVKLTAWGYKYPVRVAGGSISGLVDPNVEKCYVAVHVVNDGKPVAEKEIYVNGFKRFTDNDGTYEIGELPVGYQFDVEVGNVKQHVTVKSQQGEITFDITEYTDVIVNVQRDGAPYPNAQVAVDYNGKQVSLTSDEQGTVSSKVAMATTDMVCTVTVDGQSLQQPLVQPSTTFSIQITTPKEKEEEPVDKNVMPEDTKDDEKESEEKGQETGEQEEDKKEDEQIEPDEDKQEEEKPEEKIPDEIKPEEEKPLEKKPDDNQPAEQGNLVPVILQVLASLFLAVLVTLTYLFCYGMFTG